MQMTLVRARWSMGIQDKDEGKEEEEAEVSLR